MNLIKKLKNPIMILILFIFCLFMLFKIFAFYRVKPVVFFDLGNVIVSLQNMNQAKEASLEYSVKKHNIILNANFLKSLENNQKISTKIVEPYAMLDDVIVNITKLDIPEWQKDVFIHYHIHHDDYLVLMNGVDTIFQRLHKKGFKVGILSNIYQHAFDDLFQKYPFLKYADSITLSGSRNVNSKKPNNKIYQIALERAGIFDKKINKIAKKYKGKVFFIDDLSANLDTAEKFGIIPITTEDWKKPIGKERDILEILMDNAKFANIYSLKY